MARARACRGAEGLDAEYLDRQGQRVLKTDSAGNPITDASGNPVYKKISDMLDELAEQLTSRNGSEDELYLAGQTVYENGFNPLAGGFQISGKPLEVFAQWVELVPTNQVVPVPYYPDSSQ